jgi:hypothetical protein
MNITKKTWWLNELKANTFSSKFTIQLENIQETIFFDKFDQSCWDLVNNDYIYARIDSSYLDFNTNGIYMSNAPIFKKLGFLNYIQSFDQFVFEPQNPSPKINSQFEVLEEMFSVFKRQFSTNKSIDPWCAFFLLFDYTSWVYMFFKTNAPLLKPIHNSNLEFLFISLLSKANLGIKIPLFYKDGITDKIIEIFFYYIIFNYDVLPNSNLSYHGTMFNSYLREMVFSHRGDFNYFHPFIVEYDSRYSSFEIIEDWLDSCKAVKPVSILSTFIPKLTQGLLIKTIDSENIINLNYSNICIINIKNKKEVLLKLYVDFIIKNIVIDSVTNYEVIKSDSNVILYCVFKNEPIPSKIRVYLTVDSPIRNIYINNTGDLYTIPPNGVIDFTLGSIKALAKEYYFPLLKNPRHGSSNLQLVPFNREIIVPKNITSTLFSSYKFMEYTLQNFINFYPNNLSLNDLKIFISNLKYFENYTEKTIVDNIIENTKLLSIKTSKPSRLVKILVPPNFYKNSDLLNYYNNYLSLKLTNSVVVDKSTEFLLKYYGINSKTQRISSPLDIKKIRNGYINQITYNSGIVHANMVPIIKKYDLSVYKSSKIIDFLGKISFLNYGSVYIANQFFRSIIYAYFIPLDYIVKMYFYNEEMLLMVFEHWITNIKCPITPISHRLTFVSLIDQVSTPYKIDHINIKMLDMRDTLSHCGQFLYNKFKNLSPIIPPMGFGDIIWNKHYCYDNTRDIKWTPTNIYDMFDFASFYHPIPSVSYPHWLYANGREYGELYIPVLLNIKNNVNACKYRISFMHWKVIGEPLVLTTSSNELLTIEPSDKNFNSNAVEQYYKQLAWFPMSTKDTSVFIDLNKEIYNIMNSFAASGWPEYNNGSIQRNFNSFIFTVTKDDLQLYEIKLREDVLVLETCKTLMPKYLYITNDYSNSKEITREIVNMTPSHVIFDKISDCGNVESILKLSEYNLTTIALDKIDYLAYSGVKDQTFSSVANNFLFSKQMMEPQALQFINLNNMKDKIATQRDFVKSSIINGNEDTLIMVAPGNYVNKLEWTSGPKPYRVILKIEPMLETDNENIIYLNLDLAHFFVFNIFFVSFFNIIFFSKLFI